MSVTFKNFHWTLSYFSLNIEMIESTEHALRNFFLKILIVQILLGVVISLVSGNSEVVYMLFTLVVDVAQSFEQFHSWLPLTLSQ